MEHTQGEWHAKDGQIYPLQTGKTLAVIPYFDEEDKEQQANAKLIAAAPDMLEACKLALVVLRGLDSSALVIPILEQTINKATI